MCKQNPLPKPNENGFTVVEMIVTVVILSIFSVGIFQSYLLFESQRVEVARQARASDIAYSNLRKFTTRPPNLTCNPGKMDLTANNASTKPGVELGNESNYPGSSVYGFTAEGGTTLEHMGKGTEQTVTAFAPNGCTGTSFTNDTVKIESTVILGNGESVTHASYIQ